LKDAPGRRDRALGMLIACFALSMLFAQDIYAQRGRLDPPACRDAQLSVRHVGEDAAMGGRRSIDYAFTNTSTLTCALRGFPRFEVLSRSGRIVRRGRGAESWSAVAIEPGKTAMFSVSYNAGGAGRVGRPCPTYPRVRIIAPGNKRGVVLREVIQLCGEVEVSPVHLPSGEQP
jgi:hypothetical protein